MCVCVYAYNYIFFICTVSIIIIFIYPNKDFDLIFDLIYSNSRPMVNYYIYNSLLNVEICSADIIINR